MTLCGEATPFRLGSRARAAREYGLFIYPAHGRVGGTQTTWGRLEGSLDDEQLHTYPCGYAQSAGTAPSRLGYLFTRRVPSAVFFVIFPPPLQSGRITSARENIRVQEEGRRGGH